MFFEGKLNKLLDNLSDKPNQIDLFKIKLLNLIPNANSDCKLRQIENGLFEVEFRKIIKLHFEFENEEIINVYPYDKKEAIIEQITIETVKKAYNFGNYLVLIIKNKHINKVTELSFSKIENEKPYFENTVFRDIYICNKRYFSDGQLIDTESIFDLNFEKKELVLLFLIELGFKVEPSEKLMCYKLTLGDKQFDVQILYNSNMRYYNLSQKPNF